MEPLKVSKIHQYVLNSIVSSYCHVFQESNVYYFKNILGVSRMTQFFWLKYVVGFEEKNILIRVGWDEGKTNFNVNSRNRLSDEFSLQTFQDFVQEQTKHYQIIGE